MRAIRRLICNNIARNGLQKQTNTRDELTIDRLDIFFVTTLQGWVSKQNKHACEQSDVCFVTIVCSPNDDFGTKDEYTFSLQQDCKDGLTKTRTGCIDDRLMFSL